MHISRPRISFSYGRDITFIRSSRDITFLRLSRHWRFPRSTHFSSKVIDVYLNSSYAYTHIYIYIRSRTWVSTGRELSLYFSTVSHRSFPRANRKWNEIENWPNHFNVDRDENGKGRNTSRYSIADDYDCTINIENIYSLQFITDYRTVHFVVFFRVEWFHTVKRRTYSFNVYTRSS